MKTRSLGEAYLLLFTLLVLALSLACHTTVAQPAVTLENLVGNADRIVIGEVQDITAKWDNNGNLIWTYVTLKCQQFLKGPANDVTVTIRVMGGEVGESGLSVSHTPTFSKGELTLVFLQENEKGVFDVLHWEQGKYTCKGDKFVKLGKEEPLSLVNAILRLAR